MNIRKFIAVAAATAFITAGAVAEAAEKRKDGNTRTKTQLQKENQELKAKLDSLTLELEKYRQEMEYADSITQEMLDLYEENEDKSAAGINPEDYTAEISDSLLNIWYVHKRASSDDMETYDMDSQTATVDNEFIINILHHHNFNIFQFFLCLRGKL